MSKRAALSLFCSLWLASACGDDDVTPPPSSVRPLACAGSAGVERAANGILRADCPSARSGVRLRPYVKLDGAWLGGASCTVTGDALACPAGDAGTVEARLDDATNTFSVRFHATRAVVVEGLSLEGEARVEGATSWLSNGYQSWSQSGMLALAARLPEADVATALAQTGDGEVLRDGTAMSWSFTHVGGGGTTLVAGALTTARWKPWVEIARQAAGSDELVVRLGSGGAGERVSVAAGESVDGEPFYVDTGSDGEALLRAYASRLEAWRDADPTPSVAEAGWNSWYELWSDVDEGAVRANAAQARAVLGPTAPSTPPLRIVVDDGWESAWGDWTPNDKFPLGLDGLATELAVQGHTMGVWLAPFCVAEGSETARLHPDWLVVGASYNHAIEGVQRVLDVTNPAAAAHLAEVIRTLVGWGYTLLKIDFLFAGSLEGTRARDVTGMQALHEGLQIIRDAAGPDVTLVTVGAPDLAILPYADGWRVGTDIAVEPFGPSWPFLVTQARNLGARWPLCERVLCDADPPILRVLPETEVNTGGWIPALAGGGLFLSDDLRTLDLARVPWGVDAERVSLGVSGHPAVPLDLYPTMPPSTLASAFGEHLLGRRLMGTKQVPPTRWRLPDGRVVRTNWSDTATTMDGVAVPARSVRVGAAGT